MTGMKTLLYSTSQDRVIKCEMAYNVRDELEMTPTYKHIFRPRLIECGTLNTPLTPKVGYQEHGLIVADPKDHG
ncbi:hypothetical protein L195_g023896 [Trifolium pratense]|uniref:Uncharacterized protein n=1 Tax=Trifolium pratense TaxID=57577 RepID=A0A2K3NC45_TRIPR|nr:hypothetical protein L195_g023896 [Trifolium pratense]